MVNLDFLDTIWHSLLYKKGYISKTLDEWKRKPRCRANKIQPSLKKRFWINSPVLKKKCLSYQ